MECVTLKTNSSVKCVVSNNFYNAIHVFVDLSEGKKVDGISRILFLTSQFYANLNETYSKHPFPGIVRIYYRCCISLNRCDDSAQRTMTCVLMVIYEHRHHAVRTHHDIKDNFTAIQISRYLTMASLITPVMPTGHMLVLILNYVLFVKELYITSDCSPQREDAKENIPKISECKIVGRDEEKETKKKENLTDAVHKNNYASQQTNIALVLLGDRNLKKSKQLLPLLLYIITIGYGCYMIEYDRTSLDIQMRTRSPGCSSGLCGNSSNKYLKITLLVV
uniref:Uncharacterized protein n=1 Tax=Glossina pallidipes TaxID=7398 RepID=A0A1A9ZGZ5_GLOPL